MAKSREKLIPGEFLEIDQSQTVARRRCQASCPVRRVFHVLTQPRWRNLRTQSRENLTRHVSPRSPGRGPLLAASIDARPARATSTRSTPSSRRARWARPSRSPVPRAEVRRPRPRLGSFPPRFPGRAPLHWSEDARGFLAWSDRSSPLPGPQPPSPPPTLTRPPRARAGLSRSSG